MLVMIFASFSNNFKYFHISDMFAALVQTSISSRHVIVWYNLFGPSVMYMPVPVIIIINIIVVCPARAAH